MLETVRQESALSCASIFLLPALSMRSYSHSPDPAVLVDENRGEGDLMLEYLIGDRDIVDAKSSFSSEDHAVTVDAVPGDAERRACFIGRLLVGEGERTYSCNADVCIFAILITFVNSYLTVRSRL